MNDNPLAENTARLPLEFSAIVAPIDEGRNDQRCKQDDDDQAADKDEQTSQRKRLLELRVATAIRDGLPAGSSPALIRENHVKSKILPGFMMS
ncbi:hypothetical protein D5400_08535 [Georhizobium profundi]|jgi:hypothetical protein|uniref:Uncharacterized protein n=1 Tax=Georhizobium profundi TaxID=2341112 RepID=A0A3Q8XPT9_9HYPH|nr:hypothetical protein [Georhizobium profundi]AZN71308.1 hypothetical protein D5400_08535 [Georhizobium profundi]